MLSEELSLALHGAQLVPRLARPALDRLNALAERMPRSRAGTRIVGDMGAKELLSSSGPFGHALAGMAGRTAKPVRLILFDKSDEANWTLGWHQDRTIAVRRRCESPGYGPWTVKQGIPHVEPPFSVIERMTTIRVHLDPVDSDNAPLLVAMGSHRHGRVPVERTDKLVAQCEVFACLANAGDVWVYSTPILHASHAAAPGRRRKVLQVDYSAESLPDGLEWLGI